MTEQKPETGWVEKEWVTRGNFTPDGITGQRIYGGRINRIGKPLVEQWESAGIEWRVTDPTPGTVEGARTAQELKDLGYIGVEFLLPIDRD